MRVLIIAVLFVFNVGIINSALSDNGNQNIKAYEYLEKKGEVYYKFKINNRSDINELTKIISIDNVKGNEVYAYANEREFADFMQYDLDYEVLTHPGDLLQNPKMSDFEDRNNREWDSYPTYDGYLNLMSQFETDYPSLCKIVEFGQSVQGRKLLCAKISDNVNTDEAEPKFLYTSTIHGDETAGYVLMLHLIDSLLSGYSSDSRTKNLVDNIEIWINPLANPDGTYSGGNSTVTGARRYNANNIDLNRNFPYVYPKTDMRIQQDRIESETQAFIDLGNTYSFVMSADMHGGAELIYYPWSSASQYTADRDWFEYVCTQYAEEAQANSPAGYFDDQGDGVINGYAWYQVFGERADYALYYQHCRATTIELSTQKLLATTLLLLHWNYNYRSFLNYLEQVLYGINGKVTDTITGNPLKAKIFVESHDTDSSHVYSSQLHGDYYRPIYAGTHNVTFSCDGYYSKTISNVSVTNNSATVLNVELVPFIIEDSIRVESPNGGEQWASGSTYNIIWWSNISENVKIELMKGTTVQTTISSSTPNDGSHPWNIPSDFPSGTDYRIQVTSISDPTVTDISNAYFTITAPSITVTYPNGGETLYIGTSHNITWTNVGTFLNVKILFSPDGGSNWYTVVSSTANDGEYSWTIPDSLSSNCKIQISDASDGIPIDESGGVFTIAILPTISITSPNGSEKLISGTLHNITWSHTGIVGDVKIEYTTNNGSDWMIIESSTANDGIHPWTVPDAASTNCKIRISEASDGEPIDESNAVFIIEPAPALTVTSPNGGETLTAETSVNIYWGSVGTVGNVKILFSPDSCSNWYTVISSTENDGIHPWTVPDSISTKCKIQVSEAVDGDPVDESNAVFTIEPAPVITVTLPNGGETWFVDSSYIITWVTTGTVGNVKIEYSTNGGTDWSEIVASTANDSTHPWTVKAVVSTDCKIKISEASDGIPTDESDAVFTIEQPAAITDKPDSFSLGTGFSASPNPVVTGQEITFYFTPVGNVVSAEIKIYDQVGNLVFATDKIYLHGFRYNDVFTIATWNLRNTCGRQVASGTYLAVLLVKDTFAKTNVLKALVGVKEIQ